MVEYALSDVSALPDPLTDASALVGIPPWRRAYILRYRQVGDRRLSLGVWRLMERMLAARGFQARDVAVDANGKPYLDGVFFSLSHAGDLALCAVSDAPVGCDIERVKEAPLELAPRVFRPGERAYLRAARDPDQARRRFFTLWTLKESYLKMTGEGLRLPPERLEVRMPALTLLRNGVPQPCALFHTTHGEYELSLCAAAAEERFIPSGGTRISRQGRRQSIGGQ